VLGKNLEPPSLTSDVGGSDEVDGKIHFTLPC